MIIVCGTTDIRRLDWSLLGINSKMRRHGSYHIDLADVTGAVSAFVPPEQRPGLSVCQVQQELRIRS